MADWSKIRVLDIFNPIKWKSIVESWLIKKYGGVWLEPWQIEQLMYRMLNCPDCVKAKGCQGKPGCQGCGCTTFPKMLVPWETDTCGAWGPRKETEAEWEAYKEEQGIQFILKEKN